MMKFAISAVALVKALALLTASSLSVLVRGDAHTKPTPTWDHLCTSDNNVFHVHVNLFAGELGYYEFEECDGVNPTIGMEYGETYTFVQADVSNYYHPMGFAYIADGAHADAPELEPGVSIPEDAPCVASLSCPAPMYFKDDEYLGVYSNLPGEEVADEDFGLDAYEPEFFYPIGDWAGAGEYSIKLRFDDETFTDDFFYFCHIHQFMSGRIKLTKNGEVVNPQNMPKRGYRYDKPGEFDAQCGSFGLDAFQLPNDLCPSKFVCGLDDPGVSDDLRKFSECIDAVNCFMLHGMTTGIRSESEIALFIHQMIPHHQNAVNMAKTLLHSGQVDCEDLTDDEDPLCIMNGISREIVNGQNFQIQQMFGVLDTLGYRPRDNCEVELGGDEADHLR